MTSIDTFSVVCIGHVVDYLRLQDNITLWNIHPILDKRGKKHLMTKSVFIITLKQKWRTSRFP